MDAVIERTEQVVVAFSAAFLFGVVVYLVGSFVVMRPHTPPRPFGAALRAAFTEAFWVLLTQPLLPLFYFVGRRLAKGRAGGTPVVMVHGYTQNRVNFLRLARAIARSGSGPVYGFNYPWFGAIDANAKRLAKFIASVCEETGTVDVDVVAHSLGGLVTLEYLRTTEKPRIRRVVTIASPHGGVVWRGPIIGYCAPQLRRGCAFLEQHSVMVGVPTLSIYSEHDNVVHPPTTSALAHRGGRDLPVSNVGHLALLFDPCVVDHAARFLHAR